MLQVNQECVLSKKVLFLCTGNSARSIMAEALLNRIGEGRYEAFSAGSDPTGVVNPYTVRLLNDKGYEVNIFKSEDMEKFIGTSFDFVITVCDNAIKNCPIFSSKAKKIHWGLEDPAAYEGKDDAKYQQFKNTYELLEKKIKDFIDF